MKTLYLANPYGFAAQWRARLLPELMDALSALGLEVWEPFARNDQVDLAQPGWARTIAERDMADVREADGFFAVVNGTPPDEGVMIELGMAMALNKPVFLFRDDFRRCSDNDEYPLNLMVFGGLPADDWQSHYYTSVAELQDNKKALAIWAAS